MAKRKELEQSADAAADNTPAKIELPQVESPSLSPAGPASASEPLAAAPDAAPAIEPAAPVAAAPTPAAAAKVFAFPQLKWRPRYRRTAVLAASVALAAVLGAGVGAGVGAMSVRSLAQAPAPQIDSASLEERKAMQQSIAHLSKEVATLKTNLDAANKAAHSQVTQLAKLGDRLNEKITERLASAAADVTGSVAPPQIVPAPQAQTQAEPQTTTPTPMPTPRPAIAAIEQPPRPSVVTDWTIRSARDGVALVEGHGEIYQAVLGAPLPGLGPVQTIKREDGRWMVVTPRGIIVSMRDRRYFE